MDARSFLGLEQLDETHFRLEVTTDLITPGQFLFGGCGLGACIEALEMVTQRPAIWATAQYLSFAPTASVVEIAVELPAVGKRITQGRAIASIDGREILATSAALGSGANDIDHVWVHTDRLWCRVRGDHLPTLQTRSLPALTHGSPKVVPLRKSMVCPESQTAPFGPESPVTSVPRPRRSRFMATISPGP
ncbi:MAG: hypothetical protein NT160_07955 [Actinobacteria bacterium]|nr:hypothetical protein [Actinomycetota bacterium]